MWLLFFFFKQKTAYEMRISDWSSDVCSSDLIKGVPLLTVSGKTGKGLDVLIKTAFEAREKWSRRVGTSALNRWFENAISKNPPPAPGGRRIKLRYIIQAKTRPPTFVVFGNRLDELPESYRRYLVNALRTGLDFDRSE